MTRSHRPGRFGSLSAIAVTLLGAAGAAVALGQTASPGSEPQARTELRQIKHKTVIVGDDGRVMELEAEADGAAPFTWVHDGRAMHPDGAKVRVVLRELGLGTGFLGVEMTALSESLRDYFGVPRGQGVLIAEVVPGSPADDAGLRVGDIVTEADGQPVRGPGGLAMTVRARKQGEVMEIEAWRDRQPLSLAVRIEEQERPVVKVRRQQGEITLEPLAGGGDNTFVLVDDAMGQVLDYLEGGEWKQRVERLGGTDWSQVEARVRELEGQLRALERKLKALEKDP